MSVLPSFKNIVNSITNYKLISRTDTRGTIFHLFALCTCHNIKPYIYDVQRKVGRDLEIFHMFASSTVLKQ